MKSEIELWGGIEATLNRVQGQYHDQLEYTGHYYRENDIATIATLGIKMLRYPVLWEHHQPQKDTAIDWDFAEKNLCKLRDQNIKSIVGLVHHGSGPQFVNFFDGSFEKGLAEYAATVAEKFPWVEYYTPVNEPLTTARFCGLYGHWYPHRQDEHSFYTILISECKATVLAMKAIRQVNPNAKLIQTEDLGKTHSTPLLQYQARFDNHRRWLSFDLLCGRVDERHPLWNYLTTVAGITPDALSFFGENKCSPDICGLNYYMTSERYLDEDFERYSSIYHSGNGRHRFADVERVRIESGENWGAKTLLREAYNYLHLPIAVTECHLHCTRDEQMRWFYQIWCTARELQRDGIDIRAVTAWALFGTYGWDKLMTAPGGTYETGAFKVTNGFPEPTAFARLLQTLATGRIFHHPVLQHKGWWQRDIRLFYGSTNAILPQKNEIENSGSPLLVTGEKGILAEGFRHICFERNLKVVFANDATGDLSTLETVSQLVRQHQPWAVVHIEGYKQATNDDVTKRGNTAVQMAAVCKVKGIRFAHFSPQPTAKGSGPLLNAGNDTLGTVCFYNAIETKAEKTVLAANPDALLIRTGSLFSPWDKSSWATAAIKSLRQDSSVPVSATRHYSFAYVPDVVHIGLDWLLDEERGMYYMANSYHVSQSYLMTKVANLLKKNMELVSIKNTTSKTNHSNIQLLPMNRRIKLPSLEHALQRYVETVEETKCQTVAVPA